MGFDIFIYLSKLTLMKPTFYACLFLFTTSLYSQSFIQAYADVVNQTSQTNITNHLTDFENLGVKRRGTSALQNTLNWIKSEYTSYGYSASQLVEDSFQNGAFTCKNLIVTKTGTVYPDTYVIICGHYDTISGTGTNDNGSGTSSILEVARLLQNIPTEYSIKFIHFSGEEDGLIGSEHYVSSVVNATNPKLNIKVVLNLDQVGGVAGETNNTITCERDLSNPSSNNAASYQKTLELQNCFELYTSLNTVIAEAYGSDYVPFENNGEIITGLYEYNESPHPHSPSDSFNNMDPVFNYNVAKGAVAAMLHYAVANPNPLAISDYSNDNQVVFYPNPTQNNLHISIGNLNSEKINLQIIDWLGKIVLEKEFNSTSNLLNINVSTLAKGMYMARITSTNQTIARKIVIN